jgi:hypothetical protein
MPHLLLAALVVAAPAPADNLPDDRARAITPFLDAQTYAVVRLDLTKVDAEGLVAALRDFGLIDEGEVKALRAAAGPWLGAFGKAGGKELYYVFSLADGAQVPFAVVPLGGGADAAVLAGLLNDALAAPGPREKVGEALFAGDKAALARVRGRKPAARPELRKALAAAGDRAVQAAFIPPPQLGRLLEGAMPNLPAELGGASSKPLTRGVEWAALGLDVTPAPAARLVVQAPDAASAKGVERALVTALKSLAAQAEVPEAEKFAARLAPAQQADRIVLALDGKEARAAQAVVRHGLASAAKAQAHESLKQLVLAAMNHADSHGGDLPAVAILDKGGKPLLSWRVALLPYLGEEKLYKEFHLNEAWDSPHNRKLIARMPAVFRGPSWRLNAQGKTVYLAPTGATTAWPGGPKGLRFPASITDGTSNTIFLVMADDAHAVEWTRPVDLTIDPGKPHAGLGRQTGAFLVGMADGSAHPVQPKISKETLAAAFTPSGGEVLGPDW